MNWRWLILDFIPPEFELNRTQRREIKSHVIRFQGGTWRLMLCIFTFSAISLVLLLTLSTILVSGSLSQNEILAYLILMSVAPACIFYILIIVLYRPAILRALDFYMHLLGRCGQCGYDLRVLEADDPGSANCPECGYQRIPTVEELRHSTCRACGYDLKGLPDSSKLCPECGAKRL